MPKPSVAWFSQITSALVACTYCVKAGFIATVVPPTDSDVISPTEEPTLFFIGLSACEKPARMR